MEDDLKQILNNFSIDYIKQKAMLDEKEVTDGGRYIILVTNNK